MAVVGAGETPAQRGACQRCGRAEGWLRHAPPPSPVSGVWCDPCYEVLAQRARLRPLAWGLSAVVIGLGLWWLGA